MRVMTWFERAAWIGLLAVSAIIGVFGVGDMLGGASDLQNGETVLMHSLTGQSWNEVRAASPGAANLIDWKFRTDGASLAVVAGLCLAIGLSAFRRGERWAWGALWALPAWMVLTAGFTAAAVRYPGYGTPIPVISGTILTVVCVICLAASYRRFLGLAREGAT